MGRGFTFMDRLICVAFPRTASTYLTDALKIAYPDKDIWHIFHKIEVLRKESNIITILRKPEDAISSWLTKVDETDIEGHLDWYNRFMLATLSRISEVFITTFEAIVSDVNAVIAKCAEFYSLETPRLVDIGNIKHLSTSNNSLREKILQSANYLESLNLYKQVLHAA